jgi:GTP-binding protein
MRLIPSKGFYFNANIPTKIPLFTTFYHFLGNFIHMFSTPQKKIPLLQRMEIQKIEFVKSSSAASQCPDTDRPEYAFIGRSNVGKSSLINAIARRKNMAKTSGKPGKTKLINHFLVNQNWYLVDLPGYGYARISKTERAGFSKLNSSYIRGRKNLVNLFVLIDVRHEPQKIDMEFMTWLGQEGAPFSMVFTKGDKCSKKQLSDNVRNYLKAMKLQWEETPPHFITSAETGLGREEILAYIHSLNESCSDIDWKTL